MKYLEEKQKTVEILSEEEDYFICSKYKYKISKDDYEKIKTLLHRRSKAGYTQIVDNDGKVHLLHRYIMGEILQNLVVDHINGDILDNRFSNLRIVTKSKNTQNTLKTVNKTGMKGVTDNKGKFRVMIRVNKQKESLGTYESKEIAGWLYNQIAQKIYGDDCAKNIVPDFSSEYDIVEIKGKKNNVSWRAVKKLANTVDEQYIALVQNILKNGEKRVERTLTGTISVFAPPPLVFDVSHEAFPLITTKKVNLRLIAEELTWFLSGSSAVADLRAKNVNIWNNNENHQGRGGMYGHQWRYFGATYDPNSLAMKQQTHVDQIANAIDLVMHDPSSRRILVDAWNPLEIQKSPDVLPPCHLGFQLYVRNNGILDMMVQFRGNDIFLGNPFNISSYSLLLLMIAYVTNKEAGRLTYVIGDAHIYSDHVDQIRTQISRSPFPLPRLYFDTDIPRGSGLKGLLSFRYKDFKLIKYQHHPPIYGKMSA